MSIWRMAFRMRTDGPDLWADCLRLGIAAIEYVPMIGVDLSKYRKNEPRDKWKQLASGQVYSLRQVAYEMKRGDLIFAKSGPLIVGRGRILGPYQFDRKRLVIDPEGKPWEHQVPVKWQEVGPVEVQLGRPQITTVRPLSEDDVRLFEKAYAYQYGAKSPALP